MEPAKLIVNTHFGVLRLMDLKKSTIKHCFQDASLRGKKVFQLFILRNVGTEIVEIDLGVKSTIMVTEKWTKIDD